MAKSTKITLIIISILTLLSSVYSYFVSGLASEAMMGAFLGLTILGSVYYQTSEQAK